MIPERPTARPVPPGVPYVLLIEHIAEDEALAQRILKKYRIANHVVWIRDGEETVHTLRAWMGSPKAGGPSEGRRAAPQMVLLSFSQPRTPALEIARQIRALPGMGNIPIAFCCRNPEEEKAARESGLARTCPLSKPMGFFKLLECIQKMEMHWLVFAENP